MLYNVTCINVCSLNKKQEVEVNPRRSRRYTYQTGNGISADQKGELKKVGNVEALAVQGEYKYPGEHGDIEVSYTADENGFQPKGAHLPTAPPVPEAIQRALAYLATAPPQPEHPEHQTQ
ncbi:hypothetical protein K1T71_004489 [Dendrolimus kikuchii]|uniref:Uncharacterized protein n=1 Tax=Dendrolimus kikuchii TaxID=765133 RepID=A0ACC1D7K1_9NEOP|nr:hypothetical protein K1T71_004489 [Dendrolimus kikuchii]